MKFRKKSVEIEAEQWVGDEDLEQAGRLAAFLQREQASFKVEGSLIFLDTPMGMMTVYPGDWVYKDSIGDVYPMANSSFTKSYEPAL